MNVLITGGLGFIGSALAKALVEKGFHVRILDKPDADRGHVKNIEKKIEIVGGDFTIKRDAQNATRDIDVVVHLACSTIPATSNANPVADVKTNLLGTVKLLDIAAQNGVKKFVYGSTGGAVYGRAKKIPITENHPTEPLSSYGAHKLAVEKYLALFEKMRGLKWAALRASNAYGKNQSVNAAFGAVTVFADAVKKRKPITIWGDGTVTRDYIHISDLVRAYVAAIEKAAPSRIYNVGTGKGTTLNELVALLARVSGIEPKVVYKPGRAVDAPVNVLDCSRAKKELSWTPKIELDDGLKEYFE